VTVLWFSGITKINNKQDILNGNNSKLDTYFSLKNCFDREGILVVRDSSVVRRHYIFLLEPWEVRELSELQIKKNSCQTLGPASKRVLPDLLFFRNFLIFHFQYSMIKGTILKPWHNSINDYYDQNQIKDIAKRGLVTETTFNLNSPATSNNQ
jgi:hypothetical protein